MEAVGGARLLPFEDMLVELLLQAFIGQVDAQLLKAVVFEGLEPVNVQNADRALSALPRPCSSSHPKVSTNPAVLSPAIVEGIVHLVEVLVLLVSI